MASRCGCWVLAMVMMVGMMMMAENGGQVEGAVNCAAIAINVGGCLNYVKFNGPAPARNSVCCNGVKKIDAMATTQPIRREICTCLHNLAQSLKPNPTAVNKLAALCGISHGFNLS